MPSPPLNKAQRMSYRIGRGETGVLTFEPYKSEILPLWRFKTPSIAQQSSSSIYAKFLEYGAQNDFVGMDMARKFLQMGMTRAKRYANHKGGRKYDKETGRELEKSMAHEGREEKLAASEVFKEVWERAKRDEGYQRLKEGFVKEQKEWDRERRREVKEWERVGKREDVEVKEEQEDERVKIKEEKEEYEAPARRERKQTPKVKEEPE